MKTIKMKPSEALEAIAVLRERGVKFDDLGEKLKEMSESLPGGGSMKKSKAKDTKEALEALEGIKSIEKLEKLKTLDDVKFDGLGEKLKAVSESLARASEGLTETSPWKIDYDKIYEKWFPGEILTVERFEGLPKRILKLFGADCIYMLANEYFIATRELTTLPTAKRLVKDALVHTMKNISRIYKVDLIDIEERLRQKKVSEELIETVKRFFL